jgi:hypothetical protein
MGSAGRTARGICSWPSLTLNSSTTSIPTSPSDVTRSLRLRYGFYHQSQPPTCPFSNQLATLIFYEAAPCFSVGFPFYFLFKNAYNTSQWPYSFSILYGPSLLRWMCPLKTPGVLFPVVSLLNNNIYNIHLHLQQSWSLLTTSASKSCLSPSFPSSSTSIPRILTSLAGFHTLFSRSPSTLGFPSFN